MNIPKVSRISSLLLVASQATVYTESFKWGFGSNFAIQIKCATGSTPAIRVQLEESYTVPATQGASDTNYVVPDGYPDIFSDIVDTNYHIKAIVPVFGKYARYKITGLAGNPSDATVTIYNSIQELGRSYGE